jgi:hypothetical protein
MWRRKTGAKAGRGEMRCCDGRGCKVRGRKPASEVPSATRPGYHRGCRGTNEKNRRDANSGLRHNAELQSRRAPLCRRWPALITYASVLLGLTWAGLAPLIAPALPGAFRYSMTSSASARSLGAMVRPIAFAVLRLITSSYLVGACTGRSAGFSPLRMRST